jgi:hypothetical protein
MSVDGSRGRTRSGGKSTVFSALSTAFLRELCDAKILNTVFSAFSAAFLRELRDERS